MDEIALSEILGIGDESPGSPKARRRRDILQAARDLIAERGGPSFTVAELAERAGVSRRTVFNHFASVDDVISEIALEEIAGLLDKIDFGFGDTTGIDDAAIVFGQLAAAFSVVDLPTVLFRIQQAMGGFDVAAPAVGARLSAAFLRVESDLSDFLAAAYPDIDPLDVRIAVMSLVHGLAVIAPEWAARHADGLDDAAREDWRRLLNHLIGQIAGGYERHI